MDDRTTTIISHSLLLLLLLLLQRQFGVLCVSEACTEKGCCEILPLLFLGCRSMK